MIPGFYILQMKLTQMTNIFCDVQVNGFYFYTIFPAISLMQKKNIENNFKISYLICVENNKTV